MTWRIGDKVVNFSGSFVEFAEENFPENIVDLFLYMNGQDESGTPTEADLVLDKNGNHINYFSVRKGDDPLVSYLPAGKEHKVTGTGSWVRDGRQTMKVGKWIKAIISQKVLDRFNIKDAALEKLSNTLKAWCDDTLEISVVRGNDILTWYNENKHASSRGNLGSSCMRYSNKNKFMQFYADQPEVSMVILTKAGKIHARAILWDIGNFKLMDRMYTEETYMEANLVEWANENGYSHLSEQTYGCSEYINPEGGRYTPPKVNIQAVRTFEYMPYMDSFRYYKDGSIYNYCVSGYKCTLDSQEGNNDVVYRYENTDYDGKCQFEYVFTCSLTKKTGNVSNAIEVDIIGKVHRNQEGELKKMGYLYSSIESRYILDGIFSKFHNDVIRLNDSEHVERLDSRVMKAKLIMCDLSGKYEVKQKCKISAYHNSFIHEDDCSAIRNPLTGSKDYIHDDYIIKYLTENAKEVEQKESASVECA